uniref:ATP synthase complex subunit 8 n=1 Tax=Breviceps adspersus TaxID=1283716 RepID=W0TIM2_9NEOB|nr:ATP synthase F0 subunit 8 [Breviceps adspersus]BAO42888.1 ATPase subunit 8 [Breviceps adspersus]
MPQLLPNPWFYIFFSSWIILLLFPRKILTNTTINNLTLTTTTKPHPTWTWPWS